jgi:hypothetical protein
MPDGTASQPKDAARVAGLRWPIALAALGGGAVFLAAGLWFLRLPIGEAAIRGALAQSGVEANFSLLSLDFGGAVLSNLRVGAAETPDVAIERIEAQLSWGLSGPRLNSLRLTRPMVRASLDSEGRFSLGALDRFSSSGGEAKRSLPRMRLDIVGGQFRLDAPMGAILADFQSFGRIGEDFEAAATIPQTTLRRGAYALDLAPSALALRASDTETSATLNMQIESAQWASAIVRDARVQARLNSDRELSSARLETAASLGRFEQGETHVQSLVLTTALGVEFAEAGYTPRQWQGQTNLIAERAALDAETSLDTPRLELRWAGQGAAARGDWTLQAQNFSGFALRSGAPSASGAVILAEAQPLRIEAQAILRQTALSAEAQSDLRQAIPALGGSPLEPTLASAEQALDRAADRFDLTIPVVLSFGQDGGRLMLPQPIEARAATGAIIRAVSLRPGQPGIALAWPSPRFTGALAIEMEGSGVPKLALALNRLAWTQAGGLGANGGLTIEDWRAGAASLAGQHIRFILAAPPNADASLTLDGQLLASGPIGDGQVRDLALDLNLDVTWREGWQARPSQGCVPARFAALEVAGLAFQNGSLSVCALGDGPLMATDPQDRLSGGFFLDDVRLQGRMIGDQVQPARLNAQRIEGRFSGTSDHGRLDIAIAAPVLAIEMEQNRLLELRLQSAGALARFGGDSWRVDGAFTAGTLADPALPGTVSAIAGRWSMAPKADGDAVINVAAGAARVDAVIPPEGAEDRRPLFQPMLLSDVEAVLQGGVIDAHGRILLQADGRDVATFTARHQIEQGVGTAHVDAANFVFNEGFQPFQLSELARGVAADVRGPASATADVHWTKDTMTGEARVRLDGVSLAAASIPIIEDVRGDVHFNDIFALTTPPGQELTIGLLNPGIAVRDGRVRFQLVSAEQVNLESAEFQFASGVLSVEPTTLNLGSEETALELTLRDVDVATLIEQLQIKDLTATGTVEGSFPLVLTPRTALIHGGVLRASPEGGAIAYTGQAGDQTTGAARMAFQALSSFRYDNLSLSLDGDLNGELVSAINFSGRNSAPTVDMGEISPVPGLGSIRARNIPFAFNVNITAPFRSLADTAAGLTDARSAIDRALQDQNETPEAGEEPDNQTERSVDVQAEPLR